ncbi:MAG: PmoA family protein [Pirellulaceae bacterium]|nr:PmoA family protein [Pirellulaceae bacterium]
MIHSAVCLLLAISGQVASAQVNLPAAKPVPRMQVIPLPGGQASIERDGQEISRYHFGPELRRPFLFPLVGPSGKSLTRMGHPRDANGHSHHNSVWVTHHDVGGVAFWNDAPSSKGRIVHRRVTRYEDADEEALIDVVSAWQDDTGRVLLEESRAMRFIPQEGGQWLLVLDLSFAAPKEPVTLGKTNFGMIGVRMAKTIGVHDGGGMIRNSAGGVNEAGVHEKPARWCDYSGPITKDAREGITLFDHPANPKHPTVFHVRDDGWMGAALTFAEPRTIEPGKPLKLRYGLWIHAGVPTAEAIEEEFAAFGRIRDVAAAVK